MNTLILNDGSKLEYTLGGAVSMIGDMYIDIPNITLTKAVIIFQTPKKQSTWNFGLEVLLLCSMDLQNWEA